MQPPDAAPATIAPAADSDYLRARPSRRAAPRPRASSASRRPSGRTRAPCAGARRPRRGGPRRRALRPPAGAPTPPTRRAWPRSKISIAARVVVVQQRPAGRRPRRFGCAVASACAPASRRSSTLASQMRSPIAWSAWSKAFGPCAKSSSKKTGEPPRGGRRRPSTNEDARSAGWSACGSLATRAAASAVGLVCERALEVAPAEPDDRPRAEHRRSPGSGDRRTPTRRDSRPPRRAHSSHSPTATRNSIVLPLCPTQLVAAAQPFRHLLGLDGRGEAPRRAGPSTPTKRGEIRVPADGRAEQVLAQARAPAPARSPRVLRVASLLEAAGADRDQGVGLQLGGRRTLLASSSASRDCSGSKSSASIRYRVSCVSTRAFPGDGGRVSDEVEATLEMHEGEIAPTLDPGDLAEQRVGLGGPVPIADVEQRRASLLEHLAPSLLAAPQPQRRRAGRAGRPAPRRASSGQRSSASR